MLSGESHDIIVTEPLMLSVGCCSYCPPEWLFHFNGHLTGECYDVDEPVPGNVR